MDVYPANADASHPVSCEERPDGLLFKFDDGSTKFVSRWTPRPGWPKIGKVIPMPKG
jgi:hypothetical protein